MRLWRKRKRTCGGRRRPWGVTEHAELQELVKSEYMRLQMNARALKLRLWEQLRAKKFKMDVFEHVYRRLMNGRHHDDWDGQKLTTT
jgi:hypothetical protein